LIASGSAAAFVISVGVRAQQTPAQPPPAGQPSTQQAAPPQAPQPPRPPRPGETSAEYFKNIKVLKDLPAEQLRPTMEFIAASLGVQCNFCHVVGPQGGFDKDEKKQKDTARHMMQMVADINTRAFEGRQQVGCATCHHGKTPPERTPPLAVEMTPAEAARAAAYRAARAGGPGGSPPGSAPSGGGRGEGRGAGRPAEEPRPTETVDQVVDKYVQAIGGQAALTPVKSRVMKGTATTRDLQTVPVTVQEKASGEFRFDLETRPAPIIRATNGKATWVQAGPNPRDVEGLQAQQATRLADLGIVLNLKQRYQNLTVSRYSTVEGTETILVTGRPAPTTIEQLYFDRKTGLLLRRIILTPTGFGNLLEQVDYSDYRDVSGVKVPFQVRYAAANDVITQKFSDVQFNLPIDDAQFGKPAGR
jgi:photosynthetic reaction center cytochrome c subunit